MVDTPPVLPEITWREWVGVLETRCAALKDMVSYLGAVGLTTPPTTAGDLVLVRKNLRAVEAILCYLEVLVKHHAAPDAHHD